MTITTIESALRKIAAQEIGIDESDVIDDLHAPFARNVLSINDSTCLAFNIKIGNAEASTCRTFGDYVSLVKSTLRND